MALCSNAVDLFIKSSLFWLQWSGGIVANVLQVLQLQLPPSGKYLSELPTAICFFFCVIRNSAPGGISSGVWYLRHWGWASPAGSSACQRESSGSLHWYNDSRGRWLFFRESEYILSGFLFLRIWRRLFPWRSIESPWEPWTRDRCWLPSGQSRLERDSTGIFCLSCK